VATRSGIILAIFSHSFKRNCCLLYFIYIRLLFNYLSCTILLLILFKYRANVEWIVSNLLAECDVCQNLTSFSRGNRNEHVEQDSSKKGDQAGQGVSLWRRELRRGSGSSSSGSSCHLVSDAVHEALEWLQQHLLEEQSLLGHILGAGDWPWAHAINVQYPAHYVRTLFSNDSPCQFFLSGCLCCRSLLPPHTCVA
jgi:hypothetical protein